MVKNKNLSNQVDADAKKTCFRLVTTSNCIIKSLHLSHCNISSLCRGQQAKSVCCFPV